MSEDQPEESGAIEEDIDEQDPRLKGDAIGDTLYSESWVLRTMIKVTVELRKHSRVSPTQENDENDRSDGDGPIELEGSLEEDLCLLWDMTADQDVALFVLQNEILAIAKSVLEDSRAPRLTEIMVGILGNLACHSEILNSIASDDELVSLVLGLLSNTDSPTVIQCVRLLDILLRATEKGKISTLAHSYEIWKDLSFILKNSLNEELLCGTSKVLDLLCRQINPEEESELIPLEDVLQGIIECQIQLRKEYLEQELPGRVQDTFDVLTSVMYTLHLCPEMQEELLRSEGVSIGHFVEVYLEMALKRFEESLKEDESSPLEDEVANAAAVYTCIDVTPSAARVIELIGKIGAVMSPSDPLAKYFGDMAADSLFTFLHDTNTRLLEILEPLDAERGLLFLLREAQETYPHELSEMIAIARSTGSFNKVVDTYESLSAGHAR